MSPQPSHSRTSWSRQPPTPRRPRRLALEPLERRDVPAIGVELVRDVVPVSAGGFIDNLTSTGNLLFFVTVNDATFGTELWRSDGTSAGTQIVRDIRPGTASSFPGSLVNVNGTLFFIADDGSTGFELWKSDGTSSGTVLVKDILPGSGSSVSFSGTPANVNGILFFAADDGSSGRELWRSDGTSAGTVLVKDILPGSGASFPDNLANVGGTLFFTANDGSTGEELWKSNGTSAGTVLVADLEPGSVGSSPRFSGQAALGNLLIFRASVISVGQEPFRSDGTSSGTFLLKDIDPVGSSDPTTFTAAAGFVYFGADDGSTGAELWKTDGTSAGTVLVRDIDPGPGFGFTEDNEPDRGLQPIVEVNGTVFFVADDGSTGPELWKTDGTSSGTVLVRDINPGAGGSLFFPEELFNANGVLVFAASDGSSGKEVWTSDGTSSGTVLVADINPGSNGSFPQEFTLFGRAAYFGATDATSNGLWRTTSGEVRGTVIDDFNGDGVQNGTEPPFPGVTVFLDNNGSGTLDVGDDSTTSAADGSYAFTHLPAGPYTVRVVVPTDFETTVPASGSQTITLAQTELRAGVNFGLRHVNRAPTDITLSNNTVPENAPGAVVGTLTATDPDVADTHTFAVNDARFEVVGNQLKLKAGVALDFEATPTVTILVTATDNRTPPLSFTKSFTVQVQDVNEAPTDITLSNNTVAENAPGAVVGSLTVSDPDNGQAFTFTVSDSRFEVVGNQLKLRAGVSLDFETTPTVPLTVTATDSGSPPLSVTRPFTVVIQDVNEAPTDLTLSNAAVPEDTPGAVVGTLTATDPDRGQTHTFAVSDPRFEVAGNQLRLRAGVFLDFEATPSVAVDVTATDSGSPPLSFTKRLTIQVLDVNDHARLGAYRFQTDGAWSLDSNGNGLYDPGVDTIYTNYGAPGGARTTVEESKFRLTVPLTTDVFNSGVTRTDPVSVPIVGDWNNDGFDEVGFFRDGIWHFDVNNNGIDDAGDVTASFGGPGDTPVVGRFFGANNPSPFGNGIVIGVFTTRVGGVARFVLDRNGNMQIDPGEETAPYGVATDDVIYGDWNGDGRTKFGVFRPDPAHPDVGSFSLDLNGNLAYDGAGESFTFGASTDGFVVGDWGGNGFDSLGVVREAPDGSGRGYFTLDVNGDRLYEPGVDQVSYFGNATDYFFSGNWHPPASALRALGGAAADRLAPRLDPADLAGLVQQGTAAWASRGYDVSALRSVRFAVADLGDDLLGLASPGLVTLDDDAAGRGWSVNGPQPGRIDALSAVMHELGHELGLKDRLDADPFTDVMAAYLPAGVRRTGEVP